MARSFESTARLSNALRGSIMNCEYSLLSAESTGRSGYIICTLLFVSFYILLRYELVDR
jgi:hypothetical protein